MAYLIRQQFNINDLLPIEKASNTVAILEPESYLAKLYEKYLVAHGFTVNHCLEPESLDNFLVQSFPDVLLFNPESYGKTKYAIEIIERMVSNFPKLLVVTIGYNIEPEDLKKFMSAGITSHINRKLSKPQDVVEVVRMILHKHI
jgi:DNA-binding NtrC family response regulator